jgi:hypothetical protein
MNITTNLVDTPNISSIEFLHPKFHIATIIIILEIKNKDCVHH